MSDITYEHIKAIAKLEDENKRLQEEKTTSDLFIARLSDENQRLKERIAIGTNTAVDRSIESIEARKILESEFNKCKDSKLLVEIERDKMKEALKTCIAALMYESTTGSLWMWARSNEPVPERLLEIRKLIDP